MPDEWQHVPLRTTSNLSEVCDSFRGHGGLPETNSRQYRSTGLFASFPEGAVLTHMKLGQGDIKPLHNPDRLAGIDPSTTLLFIMCHEDKRGVQPCLQEGDKIDETYV